jgi:hypothetical protein
VCLGSCISDSQPKNLVVHKALQVYAELLWIKHFWFIKHETSTAVVLRSKFKVPSDRRKKVSNFLLFLTLGFPNEFQVNQFQVDSSNTWNQLLMIL